MSVLGRFLARVLLVVTIPVESRTTGYIAPWYAAEIAEDCVNAAAERAIQPAPPSTPSALACMNFKGMLTTLLSERVPGSRVKSLCTAGVPVTRVNF